MLRFFTPWYWSDRVQWGAYRMICFLFFADVDVTRWKEMFGGSFDDRSLWTFSNAHEKLREIRISCRCAQGSFTAFVCYAIREFILHILACRGRIGKNRRGGDYGGMMYVVTSMQEIPHSHWGDLVLASWDLCIGDKYPIVPKYIPVYVWRLLDPSTAFVQGSDGSTEYSSI